MTYLIVVAHPDDEVLGAGGTIHSLSRRGEEVNVCILSGEVKVRNHRPSDEDLNEDLSAAMEILGVNKVFTGEFPNIEFNNVPHLKLVQYIEEVIQGCKADVILTHHPSDLNNDHLHTSLACQAAVRLFQRKEDVVPIKEFLFMEINSSTDWAINNSFNQFRANAFNEIGKDGLKAKLDALSKYRGVMRPYPHPRSEESIEGLAAYRGSQVGLKYAEAFETVFKRNQL
ncbi:PIG-L deacetylase family protein [Salinicoccus luteus]|uniref:PIG-L deacetylase family protein n=1 Tax=Salinicoccus luteus TaxID=367840 RepID=UPI0004E1AEFA|nr:PIG-L deacetylase family protein [Salinicoccus luteus]